MSFTNTSKVKMVLSRRLQLTVKKSARQFKTLEGSLQSIANGERSSISSRVAELDQVIPQYLGVSRAVLESVIFCHQDDSLWPMSEPAALKKKFDEIFEALKYTKAIDSIKKLRKDKGNALNLLKVNEANSKSNKDKGDQAERKARALSDELKSLREQISQYQEKTKQAEEKYKEAFDRTTQYKGEVAKLKNHQEKHGWLQARVQNLGKDLQKSNESDEWLQSELDHFDERILEHRKQEERLLKQYEGLDSSIRELGVKQAKKIEEVGKFEEQKSNHEQQLERRKDLIRQTSREHKIRGFDGELDEPQIDQYMERISRLAADQQRALERVQRETETELRKEQSVLNELGERRSVLKENKTTAKEQYANNEQKISSDQSELRSIRIDESEKSVLKANIEDLQQRLRKAKQEIREAKWDSRINDCNVRKRTLEEESKKLRSDLIEVTKQAAESAQVDNLRGEITQAERGLATMQGVHGGKLKKFIGHDWDPASLDAQYQRILDVQSVAIKNAERLRDGVTRRKEQIEYKLNITKIELEKAEKELSTSIKHLHDKVDLEGGPEDYPDQLSLLQQNRDQLKADHDNFGNTRKYYTDAINKAQAKHECHLCRRGFHGDEETKFLKRMGELVTKQAADQIARELKENEKDLRKAKEAGPSFDTWLRLSGTEIPRLRDEVKELVKKQEESLRDLEDHDKSVTDKEEARADTELLKNPVGLITRHHRDRTSNRSKLDGLLAKQNVSGSSRSLEEISEELKSVDGKIEVADNSLTKTRADESKARSLISTLDLELSKAEQELASASFQLEKKEGISKRIEELRTENQGLRDKMKQLDAQMQQVAQDVSAEEAKLEDIRNRGKEKERAKQEDASGVSGTQHRLNLASQNIALYVEGGGPNNLARCRRELDNIGLEMSNSKSEQKQLTITINKIKGESSNQKTNKRTIADNLEYRKSLQELEGVESEISRLAAQNSEHDREYWDAEEKRWGRTLNENRLNLTGSLATAKEKDNVLQDLIKEWNTDYKEAAKEYKEAHIKVEV